MSGAAPAKGRMLSLHVGPQPYQALAPVYERSPTFQNQRPKTVAAAVAAKITMSPTPSRRPATACAGTVTATPIGTRLDMAKRSQNG